MKFALNQIAALLLTALPGALGADLAIAQAPASTQEKLDQLTTLLADPALRELLLKQPESRASTTSPNPSHTEFTQWVDSVHEHLLQIRDAVPGVVLEVTKGLSGLDAAVAAFGYGSFNLHLAILLFASLGAEWAFRRMFRETRFLTSERQPGRQAFSTVAPVALFGVVATVLYLAMSWPPLASPILLLSLTAITVFRLVSSAIGFFADHSSSSNPMLAALSEAKAGHWNVRLVSLAGLSIAQWAIAGSLTVMAIQAPVIDVVQYAFGIALLLTAMEAVWRQPRSAGSAGNSLQVWMLTAWLVTTWCLWVAGMYVLLWGGIYAVILPLTLEIITTVVGNLFKRRATAGDDNSLREVFIERGIRAAFLVVAVVWLAIIIRTHPTAVTTEPEVQTVIRGILRGAIILLSADVLWQVVKALITRRLVWARTAEGDAATLARSGRLLTLLPIFRNVLAALIGSIAVMMVLSGLGVEIGPLIAGAGIFGVAIGFGSQTLVKDVISGVFYMMDDAFRVGEYIQSGSYKGTVESFSIRSVKLRHHRGPIYTVPFGLLGAVQNMSRDWVIDKFLISVTYEADLAKVKKLVKGVGAALLADEECGPFIIETVKMKGVEAFGDYGINLSFAMMTKPGHQTSIRRRAYGMIREAFAANGIEFASPTVQVASGDSVTSAVAVAANDALLRKKLTDVAAE